MVAAALLQTIYSGFVLGAIYALMAVGLTLIWGSLRVLNLAHGALMMMGAYISWLTAQWLHLPPALGLPLSVVILAIVGCLLYQLLIAPILTRPGGETNTFIATAGFALALESLALIIFGPRNKVSHLRLRGQFKSQTLLFPFSMS